MLADAEGNLGEIVTDRRAQDLLDSIFRVATELVRGERASLLLRDNETSDFVIVRATGLADDVMRAVRVRSGEGIAGHVVASKQSLLVRDIGDAPAMLRRGQYRSASFVSVPVLVDNEPRGVLSVADRSDGLPFEEGDLQTLEILAGHIGACLVQQEQGEALQRLAETDPVTWLFNRRHFDKRLEAETNRALRAEHLLALLMIDVDKFKSINDRFGHRVGDQVLKGVASAIKQAVRLYDVPTRYGGDEFAVILPEADTEVAARVARRVLEKTEALTVPGEMRDAGMPIGLSIGVATFPRPHADSNALVEAADAAMYRAKQVGGGVRVWEHSFSDGPRGAMRVTRASLPPAPYLADPARLATPTLQEFIPRDLAHEWNAVVVGRDGQVLTVALPSPIAATAAVDAISKATGYAIYPVFSNATDLEATRRRLANS
ncbi:MAG TPA: diguanylate cyclase [Candidatus Acidoferrales bacterium]|nr:diguanylate cyclase [Candidatus Acidoferrales bacterium]